MKRLREFLEINKPIDNETKVHDLLYGAINTYLSKPKQTDYDGAMVMLNLSKLLDISVKRRNMTQKIKSFLDEKYKSNPKLIPEYIGPALVNMNAYVSALMNFEAGVYQNIMSEHPYLFSDKKVKSMIKNYCNRQLIYNKHYLVRVIEIIKLNKYIKMSDNDLKYSLPSSGKFPISVFTEPVFSGTNDIFTAKELAKTEFADVVIRIPEQKKTLYIMSIINDIYPDKNGVSINAEALYKLYNLKKPIVSNSLIFDLTGFDAIIKNNNLYTYNFTIQFIECYPDDTFTPLLYRGKKIIKFNKFREKYFLASFPILKPIVMKYWKDNGGPTYLENDIIPPGENQIHINNKISINDGSDIINSTKNWVPKEQRQAFKYNVEMLSPNVKSSVIYKYIENYVESNRIIKK